MAQRLGGDASTYPPACGVGVIFAVRALIVRLIVIAIGFGEGPRILSRQPRVVEKSQPTGELSG